MVRMAATEIEQRAKAMQTKLQSAARLKVEVIPGESLVGGGSAPSSTLPTHLLAITSENLSADELAARLRAHTPPVVARVDEGRVLLDLRTVFEREDAEVVRALSAV
jgi:L-seryl-tRNA(Ser) seleniumtransferase